MLQSVITEHPRTLANFNEQTMHVCTIFRNWDAFAIWPAELLTCHLESSLFVWLVADGRCWFVRREKYCWLIAGGWFLPREGYGVSQTFADRGGHTHALHCPCFSRPASLAQWRFHTGACMALAFRENKLTKLSRLIFLSNAFIVRPCPIWQHPHRHASY
jgi:hypothetical protein